MYLIKINIYFGNFVFTILNMSCYLLIRFETSFKNRQWWNSNNNNNTSFITNSTELGCQWVVLKGVLNLT